jgi:hypothetical protein
MLGLGEGTEGFDGIDVAAKEAFHVRVHDLGGREGGEGFQAEMKGDSRVMFLVLGPF